MKKLIKDHPVIASVAGVIALAGVLTGLHFLLPSVDPETVVDTVTE